MAVKSKEELLEIIKKRTEGDESEDTLAFIEDFTDTYDDLVQQAKDIGGFKAKYEDLSAKYKERFFSSESDDPDDPIESPKEEPKPMTFEDLFKPI